MSPGNSDVPVFVGLPLAASCPIAWNSFNSNAHKLGWRPCRRHEKRLRASSIGSRDSPEPLLCESKVGYRVPLTVLTALTAPALVTSHTPSTRLGRARHPIRASE
jgi:hypothetical protein